MAVIGRGVTGKRLSIGKRNDVMSKSPKGRDTAWRYEHDNLDRQARNNRHTPAARERDRIKRRRKRLEAAADNPFLSETRRNTAWRKLTEESR